MVDKIWVYFGTGICYADNVDVQALTNTTVKKGLVVAGYFNNVHLEYVSKDTQRNREGVWVYFGTGICYAGNVDVQALTGPTVKNGLVVAGYFNNVHLEYISKAAQQKREGVWVHFGTGIRYKGNVDVQALTNTTVKNGLVATGYCNNVHLEYISKAAQRNREGVWVHFGTDIRYAGAVDVQALTNTTVKKGLVVAGYFNNEHLEYLTKSAQQSREGVWVHFGTDIRYAGAVDVQTLTNTIVKKGMVVSGELDNQKLEYISRTALRSRKGVWVYFGTGIRYEGNVDMQALTDTTVKNGLVATGYFNNIHLEYISKAAQRNREGVWVYFGTGIRYAGNVDVQALTSTTVKDGLVATGYFNNIHLEYISKATQQKREGVWVYFGTGIRYAGAVDVQTLTNTTVKNGLVATGYCNNIHLEYISKAAQKSREGVWVYFGTSIRYAGAVDVQTLTNTTVKNGLVATGYCNNIHLEYISKAAQQKREGVWVYFGTGNRYAGNVDVQALTNTTVENGLVATGYCNNVHLEYISKTTLQGRRARNSLTDDLKNPELESKETLDFSEVENDSYHTDLSSTWVEEGHLNEEGELLTELERLSDSIDPESSYHNIDNNVEPIITVSEEGDLNEGEKLLTPDLELLPDSLLEELKSLIDQEESDASKGPNFEYTFFSSNTEKMMGKRKINDSNNYYEEGIAKNPNSSSSFFDRNQDSESNLAKKMKNSEKNKGKFGLK
ncbi:hypothetical protein ACQUW5_06925 [Legionella sp. CNM-1927-20]|uniref:hypothetical protein n=1 Tax=Legionella sp. CNM-1927-20 TaxID=3422221 RepID=UPI00403ACB04